MIADAVNHALLEERARRLAVPVETGVDSGAHVHMVFTSFGERFALPAMLVCGAFRFKEFAPLPGFAQEVVGVTVWRGSFLRVLDLQRIVGLTRPGLDDRAMIIAVGSQRPSFGLLVSSLVGVTRFADQSESPASAHEEQRLVRQVTADAVQILDGGQLLRTYA